MLSSPFKNPQQENTKAGNITRNDSGEDFYPLEDNPANQYDYEAEEKYYSLRNGQKFEIKTVSAVDFDDDNDIVMPQPLPDAGFFSRYFFPRRTLRKCAQSNANQPAPDRYIGADSMVKLKEGLTAYRLMESENLTDDIADMAPVIVCLHGMFNASYMWAETIQLLCDCDKGPTSRVLIFDFYGHGRSTWSGVELTLDVLVMQLRELLDVLCLSSYPVSLIGYDLGGAVATGFCAKFPDLAQTLTLIAPIGVKYKLFTNEVSLKIPYVGERTMYKMRNQLPDLIMKSYLDIQPESRHRKRIDLDRAMVQWQINNNSGYLTSILSAIRAFPIRDMSQLYHAIGRFKRPVLIIWGLRDRLCLYRDCLDTMEEAFKNAYFVDVRFCGHSPLIEKFDETIAEILSFHRMAFDLLDSEQLKQRALQEKLESIQTTELDGGFHIGSVL